MNDIVNSFIEIKLRNDDSFSVVKETLSRMGILAKDNVLWQSGHILHKKGKYYIVHFKQMFMLDGKDTNFDESDKVRIMKIASLLEDWGLIELVDRSYKLSSDVHIKNLTILKFDELDQYILKTKYTMGSPK